MVFAILLVVLLCVCARAFKVTHFAPDPIDASKVMSNMQELSLDANRHLSQNYLLYLDTPGCAALTEIAWNMRPNFQRSVVGLQHNSQFASYIFGETYLAEVAGHVASKAAEMPCAAVCLDLGTAFDHAIYPMPQKLFRARYDPLLAEKMRANETVSPEEDEKAYAVELDYAQWLGRECQAAEVGFVNWSNQSATIYWVNHHGELAPVGRLEGSGQANMQWRNTVLGHTFIVLADETDQVLLNRTITHSAFFPIGDAGSKIEPTGHRDAAALEVDISDTFQAEYERSVKVTRRFSALGFDKGRLPAHLWQSIGTFYYNNAMNKVREEWETDGKGLYVNWWEVNAYMMTMPHNLKRAWQQELLPLMEAWAGTELELTDIYGMRRYEDGARLLTHVDREATHAASLIINVAQGGIREPWPVEIYDHANRLHRVTMQPGDIVYYESAKCLHGRMEPLRGGFYVNLFAHYRPKDPATGKGDPQWSTRPNPEAVPAPALDLGECSSSSTSGSDAGSPLPPSSGSHSATVCSKGPPVPFLSLSAPRLAGPETLLAWWRGTGHADGAALRAIQQRQEGEHAKALAAWVAGVRVVDTGRGEGEGEVRVLDFDDGYFDEESDVLEEELWEGMGSDEGEEGHDEHLEEEGHEEGHEEEDQGQGGGHYDARQPSPQDFEEWDDEDGLHDEGHDEGHEHEHEHDGGEHLEGEGEHVEGEEESEEGEEHDHYGHDEEEEEEEEADFEPEPELKETYNPYEMPEGHNYFLPPEDGPEGDFLSDEQLRAMGYGQPEGGEGDEGGEGEEGEHWDEGYDEEL